ncbi:MAG: sugar MFS transporter [Janthinobacterium lividum]
MALSSYSPPTPAAGPASAARYTSALSAVTTLFFLWGFITSLNDILIPYLKVIFQLSYTQANLINLCFFGAFFFMSIPAGLLVARVGYKRGMLLGFAVAALGAFLFYPAAAEREYGLFLGALFVLASGITLLQVAANPYVAVLGPPAGASARLTLTQAFNSVGTTLGPVLGSAFLLSRLPKLSNATTAAAIDVRAVQIPYVAIGGVLLLISLLLSQVRLPQVAPAGDESPAASNRRIWHYRPLLLGVLGIFAYVGAEVAIGSHIVSYLALPSVLSLSPQAAGEKVAFYWGGAMVGRFAGAYLLNRFSPNKLLAGNAVGAIVLLLISVSTTGAAAMWSLLAVGLMNSLMFSTIFALAVAGLGRYTEQASGLLCTAIVGGALVPLLFGAVADGPGLRWAFVLPALCYVYIGWYGLRGSRPVAAVPAVTFV